MQTLPQFRKYIGKNVNFSLDNGETWFYDRIPHFIGYNPGKRFCISTHEPERALLYCDLHKFRIKFA